jgi:large subunit ribosomal protein L14
MVFKDSLFNILDNTGAKKCRILSIYKTKFNIYPGSIVTVVIKTMVPHKKLKKGQICKAVVVRLKKSSKKFNYISLNYFFNAVVLLKKTEMVPLGSRIFGSVFFYLRKFKFLKIITLASFLL